MNLEKKYGLFTAIGMVVGIVIGSGVFFKAQTILNNTKGNMPLGIIAWIIGGLIMICCSCTFAVLATKIEKVNGIVDYAEAEVGSRYAYFVGWFMSTIYTPSLTGVLAWLSARYFGELFGWNLVDSQVMLMSGVFLIISFAINALSPKIAGKVQVSTTVIKLIPLILMAVVGTIYGLINNAVKYIVVDGEVIKAGTTQMQILVNNFKYAGSSNLKILFAAVVSTAFAYEGWIIATTINAELKNAKRNLPIALFFGSIIIIGIYLFYYIGVAGGATIDVLQIGGAKYAFFQIFGDFFGTILTVFIFVSCFGTLNGLMLGCSRCFYSLASRNQGPKPEVYSQVDEKTNMPTNSAIMGLLLCILWLAFFYGTNLASKPWFGKFAFDSSELPIVTIYAMYLPIFIMMIIKDRKSFSLFRGIILPILAIISCLFMIFAAIYAHRFAVVYYLILYIIIMLIGIIFYKKKNYSSSISEI